MRVMVLVKATEDSEKGFVPTPENTEMLEAMGRFNEELTKAGILRAGGDGIPANGMAGRQRLAAQVEQIIALIVRHDLRRRQARPDAAATLDRGVAADGECRRDVIPARPVPAQAAELGVAWGGPDQLLGHVEASLAGVTGS